jgi:ADP-L-glycero-D-manno-heptose 6-epimerase
MIIVTGAAGFIGSHVANFYKAKQRLLLVDKPDFFRERKYVSIDQPQAMDFAADRIPEERQKIVDLEYFPKVLNKITADEKNPLVPEGDRIECVIHLGACTDTGETNWDYLTKNNIEYSQTIWNWCVREKIPLIYASSGATYGDGHEGFSDHHEIAPRLKPLNLYGQSKQDFDLWALDQAKAGNAPPHWHGLKFFNVYGPHEAHKGRMASSVLHSYRQVRDGGACTLFRSHKEGIKDGEQRRDFIHVEDIVGIIEFLRLEKPMSGLFNCGTGQARTFLDMAHALFDAVEKPVKIDWMDTPERYRKAYQYFTQAEMERLRYLGFKRPFISLEEGIKKYTAWLKDNDKPSAPN